MFFSIPSCKANNTALQIIQLTDSHLLEDPTKTFAGISPFHAFSSVLQHIQQHHLHAVDAILSTGDLAQEPTTQTYQQYLQAIQHLNKPHFFIRGNHDDSEDFPHPTELQDKNTPTVITIGSWCIILLNSQVDHCIYGEISTSQCLKLKKILEDHPNYHIVIALHHHIFPVGSHWLDQHILKNSNDFLNYLIPYRQQIKAVLSGHVHQEFQFQFHGIQFLSTPSTCIQFKPQNQTFGLDEKPPGYRILYLHDDGKFESKTYYLTDFVGKIDHTMAKY